MNNREKPQQQIVTAKDVRYLWIGLVCWIGTVAVGFLFSLDARYLFVVCILIAMLLIPLVLIVMSFWKRHYFVGIPLIIVMVLFCFLLPTRRYSRDAAHLMLAGSNLRNTVIAMHNYHEKHNHMPPPAITAADGTQLLSWRVIILPYLGEEKLYNEFHLNESWNSEHNRKLIPRMPDIYKSVGKVQCPEYHTFIQAFVGPGTILDPKQVVTLGQITLNRGTANTILAAEGGHPVVWTQPEDIPFTLENGIGPIGGEFTATANYPDRVHIAFADGSIHCPRPPFPLKALGEATQWKSTKAVEIDWE